MMQWILRSFFTVFALVLSLQLFPVSPTTPDFRFLPVAGLLIAAGLGLEAAAPGVDGRILAGALVGLVAGAAAGAAFWRLVPDTGIPGAGSGFLRPAVLLLCLYLGGALGARKAEGFSWEAFHSGAPRTAEAPPSKILDTSVIIDGRI